MTTMKHLGNIFQLFVVFAEFSVSVLYVLHLPWTGRKSVAEVNGFILS